MTKYFVYVLCNFERFYVGFTTNINRRLKEHGKAKLSHRNKNFSPVLIEIFFNKTDAKRRENYLKSFKGRATLKAMLRETLKEKEPS
ncbi:MAG: hypothetical protein A3J76_03295 [Candidatus Moranbacteria bacterium RBG_13_45_13]|nr:MAG: hypothetical protein A3J76_03295 [Candidatus Moranbacteria bacterium RBG_13_45_13]